MSVVKLSGGLGNQLFQVAFAVAISKLTLQKVGLDTTLYTMSKNQDSRKLEIGELESEYFYFCDSTNFISKFANRLLSTRNFERYERLAKSLKIGKNRRYSLPTQREKDLVFDLDIDLEMNSYFEGSFITPQYWGVCVNEVLAIMRDLIQSNFPNSQTLNKNKLTVHIRRGDYLTNIKARRFHGICGYDYYLKAIRKILDMHPEIGVIEIFSDETSFAEELANLITASDRDISINRTIEPKLALVEMSISDYFVGCNSTFSWWASVLNKNRASILPSEWYLDPLRGISPKYFFLGNVESLEMNLE